MRYTKSLGLALAFMASLFLLAPKAGATVTDERTTMTFNQPVEIPGMVLPAGTYIFKVVDHDSGDRTVIEVLDNTETHVFGTFLTRPVVRLGKEPAVTFAERPAGSPPAVAAWFPLHAAQSKNDAASIMIQSPTTGSFSWIPNEGTDGHEFVYPRNQQAAVYAAANQANQ